MLIKSTSYKLITSVSQIKLQKICCIQGEIIVMSVTVKRLLFRHEKAFCGYKQKSEVFFI